MIDHGKNEEDSNRDGLDLDSLLDALLLDTKIVSSKKRSESLKDLIAASEETVEGEEVPAHWKALQQLAKGIDQKLIDVHCPFRDTDLKIDYARELNPQQLAAVTTIDRPLLVIAGAGSGKTRVITYKVSYLLEKGYEAGQLLLLTFTKKAASELMGRVQQLLKASAPTSVLGGTFHAFANYALRKYHVLAGLPPNFTIIDGEDVTDIISLLKTELNLDHKKGRKHFPKSATIQQVFSKAKNHEMSVNDTILTYFPEYEKHQPELEKIWKALVGYKQRSGLLDYDDLIDVLRTKLKTQELFRKALQKQIAYTLVDEYQDTNNIQREIVELLCEDTGKVTVVGDDAQSIYSFRGANFENILRFPQSFPNCGVVKLEENYRSHQRVLDFTNEILRNAKIGFEKNLFSRLPSGQKPLVSRFPDTGEEAAYIVDTILSMKQRDLEYSDFAVLTRASWQSNFIQAELIKREIPFVVIGGIKFSERRHVKDMVSFLKIMLNPMDAVAWHRILKLLEGIGDVRAREIIALIHQHHGRINEQLFTSKRYPESVQQLLSLLKQIQDLEQHPAELIPPIYQFYKPLLQQLEDDFEARLIDLDIFLEIAAKYEDLEHFLADFTLDPPSNRYQDRSVPFEEKDEKPLTISTIHSAKGLEWHTVFVPFALDGILPSVRAIASVEEIEEERRLFYVACSRAKEHLFLTMPAYVSSWDAVFTKPSRFLSGIGSNYYELGKENG